MKKVLIVDDDPLMLRTVKMMIEDRFEVFVVPSGEKAITLLPMRDPDVIVLDYEMPGMDGRQTYLEIRKMPQFENTPIVFLSGNKDAQHVEVIKQLDPAGYLFKPVVRDDLINMLDSI